MYAFNRRLEPKTILGIPIRTAGGVFLILGSIVLSIAFFRHPISLGIFGPLMLFGVGVVVVGWTTSGKEHLMGVLRDAKGDMDAIDLGIDDE